MCTVAPLTVQLPLTERKIGNPEDADTARVKSGSPNVFAPIAASVIDWLAFAIENDCDANAAL